MVDEIVRANEDGAYDLDFTDVEETRIIPVGTYPARVEEADIKASANSGQPTLYLTFELLGPEKYVGRKLRYAVSLQKQALSRVRNVLSSLAFPLEELRGQVRLRPAMLLDRTGGIRVEVRTNQQGEQVNGITRMTTIDKVPAESVAGPEAPFEPGTVGEAATSSSDGPRVF